MKLSEKLGLSGRRFYSPAEILEFVASREDVPTPTKLLLLLDTTRQRTWLAATGRYLYCIFDIRAKQEPSFHWRLSKHNLMKDGKLMVNVAPDEDNGDDRSTGLVKIADKNDRKFSRRLFQVVGVKEQIERLLE